jgi:predicted permease
MLVWFEPAESSAVMVEGHADVVRAAFSTANLFDVLGAKPLAGRTFVADDEPRNVAILSFTWWQRGFHGDPDIVGKFFELGADRMEIVGVMPETFRFVVHSSLGDPRAVDVWLPTRWALDTMSDGSFGFAALVRVAPDSTLVDAQRELDVIGGQLDETRYKGKGFGWQLTGVRDDLTRHARAPLTLLAIASALLLLVVAANMAGLMLTRQRERQREFTVRTAIGAPRSTLVRLVLLESVTLWASAGAAGLVLARVALQAVAASSSLPVPRLDEALIDLPIVAVTLGLSVLLGVLFGLVPAWRATRNCAANSLRDIGRGLSPKSGVARSVLVTAEVALAVILVAAGTVLVRSYESILAVDPGFAQDQVLLAYLPLDTTRYEDDAQAVDLFRRVIDGALALPGVRAAGGTTSRPLSGDPDQTPARPSDWVAAPNAESDIMSDVIRVTPGYLDAQGIDVIEGRDFLWADRADTEPVAIVDERFARQAWPNSSGVGKTVTLGQAPPARVVGVVRHARQYRLDADDRPQVLRPYAQDTTSFLTLAIRTTGDPEALLPSLRRVVANTDVRQPVARVTTMGQVVDRALVDRLLQLSLVAAFAIGAILLAAIGVYGVLSSLVADRGREIGIRMALGASAGTVRRLVMGRMGQLTLAGLGAGLAATLGLSRWLDPLLFSVSSRDPISLIVTVVFVLAAAALAAYLPARRATSIDPARALKAD